MKGLMGRDIVHHVFLDIMVLLVKIHVFCNQNGICDDGINGNGYCRSCNENYYGLLCNSTCTCVNGLCDHLNGTCYCNQNYFGKNCDQKCISSDCSISCVCNDSNACSGNNICNSNVVISNETTIFNPGSNTTNLTIQGSANISQSNLNLNSIDIIIERNLTISSSTLNFNNSSIVTAGCVNISNAKISVNLTKITKKLVLISSTSGCLNITSTSISYTNQPSCTQLTKNQDFNSLSVVVSLDSNCDKTPLNPIVIAVIAGSIVGLIIIIFIFILAIPSLRQKIMRKKKI